MGEEERCRNCLYWGKSPESGLTDDHYEEPNPWGECQRYMDEGGAVDQTTLAYAWSPNGGTALLTTEGNFGCTQFKHKKLAIMK